MAFTYSNAAQYVLIWTINPKHRGKKQNKTKKTPQFRRRPFTTHKFKDSQYLPIQVPEISHEVHNFDGGSNQPVRESLIGRRRL